MSYVCSGQGMGSHSFPVTPRSSAGVAVGLGFLAATFLFSTPERISNEFSTPKIANLPAHGPSILLGVSKFLIINTGDHSNYVACRHIPNSRISCSSPPFSAFRGTPPPACYIPDNLSWQGLPFEALLLTETNHLTYQDFRDPQFVRGE